MNDRTITLLAESIAAELFVNGQGEHAERLVLQAPGGCGRNRDLGGWGEGAVRDLVARRLRFAVEIQEVALRTAQPLPRQVTAEKES